MSTITISTKSSLFAEAFRLVTDEYIRAGIWRKGPLGEVARGPYETCSFAGNRMILFSALREDKVVGTATLFKTFPPHMVPCSACWPELWLSGRIVNATEVGRLAIAKDQDGPVLRKLLLAVCDRARDEGRKSLLCAAELFFMARIANASGLPVREIGELRPWPESPPTAPMVGLWEIGL